MRSRAADNVHRVSAAPYDRLRLTALRNAVNDESEQFAVHEEQVVDLLLAGWSRVEPGVAAV